MRSYKNEYLFNYYVHIKKYYYLPSLKTRIRNLATHKS